tara:strand:+ start:519 stop:674 length:156 start_codon:yes stop_codon:yes gene_type:complete
MKRTIFIIYSSLLFSQALLPSKNYIDQLKTAVENAARSGQVVWAEEFSGLT